MQVFVPFPSPIDIAKVMWTDQKRYNKQIIEVKQIIKAIDGAIAWSNHPIVKMYKEHEDWLLCYLLCLDSFREFMRTHNSEKYDNAVDNSNNADAYRPSFIDDRLCDQHKRRLYTKSPSLYPQFEKYGKSDVNFYVVDGELVKYRNGKRIE